MADKHRVTVTIAGYEYHLKGENKSDYLASLAREVDARIHEIKLQNPNYTTSKAAILLAIQLQDEMNEIREDYDKLVKELDHLQI